MRLKTYHINVKDLTVSDVYPFLSKERQDDVDSKRFMKDKRLSAGAGILMKRAFFEAGITEEFPVILTGPDGKPYLRDYPDIHFNLSHSGSYVFLVTGDSEVGCDVEEVGAPEDFTSSLLPVAERFFTGNEFQAISSLPDQASRNILFHEIWTMKESFLKACGRGISASLNTFDVLTGDGTEGAVFETYDIAPGYVFTSCMINNGQDR